jgi:hypothetical protein
MSLEAPVSYEVGRLSPIAGGHSPNGLFVAYKNVRAIMGFPNFRCDDPFEVTNQFRKIRGSTNRHNKWMWSGMSKSSSRYHSSEAW